VSLFLRAALFSSFAVGLYAQGVVSVDELRRPLTGNSLRAILTAQEHLKSGQRERGMEELRQAMNDPLAMPYAISILGAEHLKTGQTDTALSELEQAVGLLPRPENHSNLALALYRARQTERGLEEVRKALRLDPAKSKTRLVLGLLLLQQGSHDAQAIRNLEAAAEEVPRAHLILAHHYAQAGQAAEAERERRAYEVTSMGLLALK
jgi:tetratricopeptide (TPR) repeat protein